MWPYVGMVFVVCLAAVCFWKRKPKGLAPGPRGLPLVGNALQLDRQYPHQTLSDLAKRYGDIYSINLFGEWFTVLSGEATIREALVTKSTDFAGRPYSFRPHFMANFSSQVTFDTYTPKWQKMKKLMLTSLHSYGDRLGRLEELSVSNVTDMIDQLHAQNQQPFDPLDIIRSTFANIIALVLYGKRLEQHRLNSLLNVERPLMECNVPMGEGAELDLYPWLRYLGNRTFHRLKALKKEVKDWFDFQYDECINTSDCEGMLTQLVSQALKVNGLDEKSVLDEGDIKGMTQDIMFAGIVTSSTLVYECLAILTCKQDVQRRLQEAIRIELGDAVPTLEDRAKLPVVMATLYELLRLMSHVPLAIPHATTTDVTMETYKIPKGGGVILNLWNLHHDERYWDDPWVFSVDRFLTPDGQLLPPTHPKRKRLLAFSAGRRVCPGQTLAVNRIFLMLVMILQKFTFMPPEDGTLPRIDPRSFTMGIVLSPERYKLRAVLNKKV